MKFSVTEKGERREDVKDRAVGEITRLPVCVRIKLNRPGQTTTNESSERATMKGWCCAYYVNIICFYAFVSL
jgi:hypothetical protein